MTTFGSKRKQDRPVKQGDKTSTTEKPRKKRKLDIADNVEASSLNEDQNPTPMEEETTGTDNEEEKTTGTDNEEEKTTVAKKKTENSKATTKENAAKRRSEFNKRKEERKKSKSEHDVVKDAKKLWEDLRRSDLSKAKKLDISTQVYNLIQGKMKKLMLAHDSSRIIQCLMKFGTKEHRNAVFEELKDEVPVMCKSMYGKFLVKKFLKYGTKNHRTAVFEAIRSKVADMIKHKEASMLVEAFYNNYANVHERAVLLQEFYGSAFKVLQTKKDQTVEEVVAANPGKLDLLMSNMKETLTALCQKNLLQFTIVHKSFLDYFTFCSSKEKMEMIETVRESLVHMLHTRDGARVTMRCIWEGTAKDRKVIIKTFKPLLMKIAQEEYGHLTLCALMDAVDDTVLLHKSVLEPLLAELMTLASHQYGRKVVLYLLCHRDPRHFHADIVKVLQEGDNNPNSKKDPTVRRLELLQHCETRLRQFVVQHVNEVKDSPSSVVLVQDILTHLPGDPTQGYLAVINIANKPLSPSQGGSHGPEHFVESTVGHQLLKHLVQNDKKRVQEGKEVLFSDLLLDSVPSSVTKTWLNCNRGCFLFVSLLELNNPDISSKLCNLFNAVKEDLKLKKFKGAQLLLNKLENK